MQTNILFQIPGYNYCNKSMLQAVVRVQTSAGAIHPETVTRRKFYSGIYSTILLIHVPDP